MISVSCLFEQITSDEIDEYMKNLFRGLKKHEEDNKSEGEKLKDKIDQENDLEKRFPWTNTKPKVEI